MKRSGTFVYRYSSRWHNQRSKGGRLLHNGVYSSCLSGQAGSTPPDTDPADSHYHGYLHTTGFQRALLATTSALAVLANPARDDMLAALGETTGIESLRYIQKRMQEDPVGAQILREEPLINTSTVDLEQLRTFPDETLGKQYVNFLDLYKYSPDARLAVRWVQDPALAYVMLRYRQSHDLLHVLLGARTDILGEVLVKWVEALQFRLPMCGLGAVFGAIRLAPKQRLRYVSEGLPWAIQQGRQARFLLNTAWEQHWDTPIDTLREELNLQALPDLDLMYQKAGLAKI